MTRSRKLMLATALVAGGYGLAILATTVSDFFWARSLFRDARTRHAAGTSASVGSSPAESARLVPQPVAIPAATDVSGPLVAANGVKVVEFLASASSESQVTKADATFPIDSPRPAAVTPSPPAWGSATTKPTAPAEPRARLTDVKRPRAAAVAASPSPWDRWPRWDPPAAAQSPPPATNRTSSAPRDDNPFVAQPAALAAESASQPSSPWVAKPDDRVRDALADLRIHVVIDGDSLDRLADRYLDDATQGDAIFELNRAVLTDRELLPIGVELVIPRQRTSSAKHVEWPPTVAPASLPPS